MDELKNKEKREIKLYFYVDDAPKILATQIHIEQCLKRNEAIPAEVLQKLLSFYSKPFEDDWEIRTAFIQQVKRKADLILTNSQKFLGSVEINTPKHMIPPAPDETSEITKDDSRYENEKSDVKVFLLNDFLERFLNSFYRDGDYKLFEIGKDEFLKTAYLELKKYLSDLPKEKWPKPYSQHAIIGFLASQFGYVKSEEDFDVFRAKSKTNQQHYTEYLSSKAEHICKKYR